MIWAVVTERLLKFHEKKEKKEKERGFKKNNESRGDDIRSTPQPNEGEKKLSQQRQGLGH